MLEKSLQRVALKREFCLMDTPVVTEISVSGMNLLTGIYRRI